jgi:hypothetical protein
VNFERKVTLKVLALQPPDVRHGVFHDLDGRPRAAEVLVHELVRESRPLVRRSLSGAAAGIAADATSTAGRMKRRTTHLLLDEVDHLQPNSACRPPEPVFMAGAPAPRPPAASLVTRVRTGGPHARRRGEPLPNRLSLSACEERSARDDAHCSSCLNAARCHGGGPGAAAPGPRLPATMCSRHRHYRVGTRSALAGG